MDSRWPTVTRFVNCPLIRQASKISPVSDNYVLQKKIKITDTTFNTVAE